MRRPLAAAWSAVLAQALHDAFVNVSTHASGTSQTECDEARKFLFAERGPWAESRRQVCAHAGIDEQALTEKLKSKPPPDWRSEGGARKRASGRSLPTRKQVATSSARGESEEK